MRMAQTPRRELEVALCRAMQELSVRRGAGAAPPASPALSGGGVGSPITPVDEPAEVEQLRKALARQARVSDASCARHSSVAGSAAADLRPRPNAARGSSAGADEVVALAAHLDAILSTSAWEQAAPLLKNIKWLRHPMSTCASEQAAPVLKELKWLRHPSIAKPRPPTRRGPKPSRKRGARKKKAGERDFPVQAPSSSREQPQHRGASGLRHKAKRSGAAKCSHGGRR